MSEPFIGEIRMFAGTFAPRGWAMCDGQLLNVGQNDALFSLYGTIYGGDGRTTFGLPEMRGRIPLHAGNGPGLSNRRLGSKGGAENVTVTTNQLPNHTHQMIASNQAVATSTDPADHVPATAVEDIYADAAAGQTLDSAAVGNTGGSQAHVNLQPTLCLNFICSLFGIYPPRS